MPQYPIRTLCTCEHVLESLTPLHVSFCACLPHGMEWIGQGGSSGDVWIPCFRIIYTIFTHFSLIMISVRSLWSWLVFVIQVKCWYERSIPGMYYFNLKYRQCCSHSLASMNVCCYADRLPATVGVMTLSNLQTAVLLVIVVRQNPWLTQFLISIGTVCDVCVLELRVFLD